MDNLSAYPVLLSFLSYLKYFIGRLGSHPYQLVRGNIMSTDVDSSSIICANFGYYLWLSTNSSWHGKSQTSRSGKGRCDQPAKQHPQLLRRESHPRAIISSDIVSILIQDLSSFEDNSSVAFSMARSAICLIVKSYTVPFVSAGIQPTLYQYSSSRLISVSIGSQVNFHYWAFIPCTSKRAHQRRSQRRLLLLRCTGVLPTMLHST
jgi:hypothetical protein